MVRYTVEHLVLLYESNVKCGSTRKGWEKIVVNFPETQFQPQEACIMLLRKLGPLGGPWTRTLLNRHVLSEEKLDEVGSTLKHT
jgi:hypothetical protein